MNPTQFFAALVLTTFGLMAPAQAHKASDAFLAITEQTLPTSPTSGLQPEYEQQWQLSLALRDVDLALEDLDANNDRQLTWGELKLAMPSLVQWVNAGVDLQCGDQSLPLTWSLQSLEERSDGNYIRLAAQTRCSPSKALRLSYGLLKEIDRSHRLIVNAAMSGKPNTIAAVLAPAGQSTLELRNISELTSTVDSSSAPTQAGNVVQSMRSTTGLETFASFFREGLRHLLGGYDHLAFLLSLLLPISIFRGQARKDLQRLILTVSSFTLGHSLTLALGGLGIISASAAWVEPSIALSIIISAAMNLARFKLQHGATLIVTLLFGLIHGLGFSGVLSEARISGAALVWGLAGFNLGIEAAQLVAVFIWIAAISLLFRFKNMTPQRYERYFVKFGSVLLIMVATYWLMQRLNLLR